LDVDEHIVVVFRTTSHLFAVSSITALYLDFYLFISVVTMFSYHGMIE
jgi:hypothetical protein